MYERRGNRQGDRETRRQGDIIRSLSLGRWLIVLALLFSMAACGGSGYSQTAQTDSYTIQLALDGTDFAERTATIDLRDRAGKPVDRAQVVVAPIMESMGMVSPEQTARSLGDGRYQARAAFFSMIGEWEFDVRVDAGGKQETARFKVPVQQ